MPGDTLSGFRPHARIAAGILSFCSAVLTFYFGLHTSPHWVLAMVAACGLVIASLGSDYILLFVSDAFKRRDWFRFGFLAVGAVVFVAINLGTNLGAVGWQRDTVITAAAVQNVKHDDVRETVTDRRATLDLLQKRLAELQAQNAWAASVTADGLRARLASAEKAVELETARGGCKAKCLSLMKQRDELADRIKTAEAIEDLPKQIAAAKRALESIRDRSAEMPKVVAAPDSQAKFFASLVQVDLAPSIEAKTWTDRGVSIAIAIFFVFGPSVLAFVGWRESSSTSGPVLPHRSPSAPAPGLSVIGAGSTRTGLLAAA